MNRPNPHRTSHPTVSEPCPPRRRPRSPHRSAAVAVVAVGAVAFVAPRRRRPGTARRSRTRSARATRWPCASPSPTSCPIARHSPAFRGTVVAVGDGSVTLDVTKWYANGDADQVVLSTVDLATVALDGVEFAQGGDYLVACQRRHRGHLRRQRAVQPRARGPLRRVVRRLTDPACREHRAAL